MRVVDDHFIRDSIFWKNCFFFFGSWKFDSMTKARYLPLRSFERERDIVSSLFEFFSLVRYVRFVSTMDSKSKKVSILVREEFNAFNIFTTSRFF